MEVSCFFLFRLVDFLINSNICISFGGGVACGVFYPWGKNWGMLCKPFIPVKMYILLIYFWMWPSRFMRILQNLQVLFLQWWIREYTKNQSPNTSGNHIFITNLIKSGIPTKTHRRDALAFRVRIKKKPVKCWQFPRQDAKSWSDLWLPYLVRPLKK